MKILYFWFNEYKKVKDFEANFGSEYLFGFEYNNHTISVEDNKVYIKDFFKIKSKESKNPKVDISAIVGENGSGKSTILEFLSEIMNSENNENIDSEYILIYTIDERLHFSTNINKKIIFRNNSSKYIIFCNTPINLHGHLTLIFSNVFDAKSIGMHSEEEGIHYRNITTNFLMSQFYELSQFLISELEKQVYFVHEYKDQLNIQNLMTVPDKIFIKASLNENSIIYTDELEDVMYLIRTKNFTDDFFDYKKSNKFYSDMLSNSLIAYFAQIDNLFEKNNITLIGTYYKDLLYGFSKEKHNNIFDAVYRQLEEELSEYYYNDLPNKTIESLLASLKELKESFELFIDYFMNMKFNSSDNSLYIYTYSLETKEFISLYKNAFAGIDCLEFTWSDMSSGEYGMLSLFSRFHSILEALKRDEEILSKDEYFSKNKLPFIIEEGKLKYENVSVSFPTSFLLLIDEGDLYFHPQWQKDWLNYFIKLVNLLFEGEVQIILTTHSPFVLSDFPNTNVVFLKRDNNSSYLPDSIEGSPKTFASNIIELFSNSFFINDGLIGSFAKEKVNNFIQSLLQLSPEDVYNNQDELKKFIDLIGEPLIRNKILQIYHGKLELHNENHKDLGKRIQVLERELENLKNIRRNITND
ncbi:AAA family ATPase [Ornithinibacillus halotolerans]|uniref:Endonuclease GajA/Old nuclease/RecF-like AAA domain-containing protein n=1 Tax=Ornithinibacillus halotolerans TaxID=1274357 RepID=A0A916W4C8_9BACI|nr:AAA family ATPase [Ornithinibacillus halotolerans]GGA65236.1 hypothetical protein GCM10008025_06370 [Ornithinibacillus halotolerans]